MTSQIQPSILTRYCKGVQNGHSSDLPREDWRYQIPMSVGERQNIDFDTGVSVV